MAEERLIELEVINGPMDGHVFSIKKEKFSIGRAPENDISIPTDRKVNKNSHVEITANGPGEWSLAKSGRGKVHIDGLRESGPIKLARGNKVTVGKTILLVNRTGPRKPGEVEEDPLKPRDRSGSIPVHRI